MQNRYESLIREFEDNFNKLLAAYKAFELENIQLKAELERKQEDLMKAHKEVLDLRNECALLEMTGGLSGSEASREESCRRLEKIVYEIDKCLALLNE